MATAKKTLALRRRHTRVRKRVHGVGERPRLVVFRSNRHIYAQVIDDVAGKTLAAASSLDAEAVRAEGAKIAAARQVGELLGKRAKESGVEAVVFDRGGYQYHGRVASLADGARDAGLKF